MRKFAALRHGVEELGEEDDFVGSASSNGTEAEESWKGEGYVEASSSDVRQASSAAASTSKPGVTFLSVKKAEYVSSATKLSACPEPLLPEFAVIGRSNVGKSSLINMLTKNKKLALTSKQPGPFSHRTARVFSVAVHRCHPWVVQRGWQITVLRLEFTQLACVPSPPPTSFFAGVSEQQSFSGLQSAPVARSA